MRLLPGLILLSSLAAHADDLEALQLADQTAFDAPTRQNWQAFTEAAVGQWQPTVGHADQQAERLSLSIHGETRLAPDWRAVFADRLDLGHDSGRGQLRQINTLKELYLGTSAGDNDLLDLGRINVRNGVGLGYNPTDLWRSHAVRAAVSPDPDSLRDNRLGTVMLRGQHLWDGGAVSLLLAPRLASQPGGGDWDPDLGATNQQTRWQISYSQVWWPGFSPQWLLSGSEGQTPQLGLNLSGLLDQGTVAWLEWSGGRNPAQLAPTQQAWHDRLASGLTHTFANKLSLSAEWQYNSAAPDQADWQALRQGAGPLYGQYRSTVGSEQDLPTRQALFLYASWQDVVLLHLDLTLLERTDLIDHSRLSWLEARYHWQNNEAALQWQYNSGDSRSDYGAAPQRRILQLLLRHYL